MDEEPNRLQSDEPEAPIEDANQVYEKQEGHHKLWPWLVAAGLIVGGLFAWTWYALGNDAGPTITSYEECVEAGHPVMESYPEQCAVPGEATFTRELSEEEKASLENPAHEFVCQGDEKSAEVEMPDNWTSTTECSGLGTGSWYMTIKSPDYQTQNDENLYTISGAIVHIQVEGIDETLAGRNSVEKILAGEAESKSEYTHIKSVSVGSHDGVEYIIAYEPPAFLVTQFDIDGYEFTFSLEEDIDGPGFNEHIDAYREIVNSFKPRN